MPDFNFCNSCKSKHCCSQISPKGLVSNAIILPADTIYSDFRKGNFGDFVESNGEFLKIKSKKCGGCIFQNGEKKCDIYLNRPIDCHIFPFDILKINNVYTWIMYDKFCGVEISKPGLIVQQLEKKYSDYLLPFIEEFSNIEMGLVERGSFTTIVPVNINEFA